MENKQTAVERLIEQIKKDQTIKAKPISEWNIVFEQAKKMEKEQIIEANENKMPFITGEEYYKETYNK